MKTKNYFLAIILLFFIDVFSQNFNFTGINYTVTSTNPAKVAVAINAGFIGNANIPTNVVYNSVDYSVTQIVDNAFENSKALTSVSIPNSITELGSYAFSGCTGLTSVIIPNSIKSIGNYTFNNCTSLTTVLLSSSITDIGNYAFQNCSSISELILPDSVTIIGNGTFFGCTSLQSIFIPNSLKEIGYSAFESCTGLAVVTIPDSVTIINTSTFYRCQNLTSVTIPNSVKTIKNGAFFGCTNLSSVIIPNSVTSLEDDAFRNCFGLKSVSVNWQTPLAINSAAFFGLDLPLIALKVPVGKINIYNATPVWTDFSPISEQVIATATHLNFDGINDFVQLNHFEKPLQFTLEAVIKTASINKNIICWSKNTTETSNSALKISSSGNLEFSIFDMTTSATNSIIGTSKINDNAWHHVAVTKTADAANNIKLYVDGVLQTTGTANIDITSKLLTIGAIVNNANVPSNSFQGDIDEVKIWDVSRSQTQIESSKNCELSGTEIGLVYYFNFNQGISAANNSSISGLAATTGSIGNLKNFNLNGIASNFLVGSSIISGNNCSTLGSDTFKISEKSISLFPNPNKGIFTINSVENLYLKIIDISGKIIQSKSILKGNNAINISEINNGIYLIKVFDTNRNIQTLKLIKE